MVSMNNNCRTYDNYSIVVTGSSHDYWGLCKPECRGEMPGPESEYNLAMENDVFNKAWPLQSHVFSSRILLHL